MDKIFTVRSNNQKIAFFVIFVNLSNNQYYLFLYFYYLPFRLLIFNILQFKFRTKNKIIHIYAFFSDNTKVMRTAFIFILLFGLAMARPNSKAPSSFRRSSVESVPMSVASFFQNYGSDSSKAKILLPYLESYSLPSRHAVEHVPTIEER